MTSGEGALKPSFFSHLSGLAVNVTFPEFAFVGS